MRILGNIDLVQNMLQNPVLEAVVNFPPNPKAGQIIFKEKRVMICLELDGGIPIWCPMTNEINTHIHNQALASTTWTINHELMASNTIVQILDSTNTHIYPDTIEQSYNQTVVTFTTTQAGRAILFLGGTEGNFRANISYEQTFSEASASWVVTHGLGYNPIIRVFIGNVEVQPLAVIHDTVNQTTVTFTNPQTGIVRAI